MKTFLIRKLFFLIYYLPFFNPIGAFIFILLFPFLLPFLLICILSYWSLTEEEEDSPENSPWGVLSKGGVIVKVRCGDLWNDDVKDNYTTLKNANKISDLKGSETCEGIDWYELYKSTKKNYPRSEEEYILCYHNGKLFDGAHRTSILLYEYGPDHIIPIKKYKKSLAILNFMMIILFSSPFMFMCWLWLS
jgi:hypothetical protein|tara:strand:- start:6994 stop:7566 length:573 start_codon:yes stop_codon:yes gene_type:complete